MIIKLTWNNGVSVGEDANVYIFDPENFSEYVDSLDIEVINTSDLFGKHSVRFDTLNMENFDIKTVKNQLELGKSARYAKREAQN